jgi:quercetin dioxygenase-like cupin family protein
VEFRAVDRFLPLSVRPGLAESWELPHPTLVRAWQGDELGLEPSGTHFVYAMDGSSVLETSAGRFSLTRGMYAALLDGRIRGPGEGLVVSRIGVFGMFHVGGPIEARGRLRYIDGCTDSLLIAPPLRGDPCLNHLHIPAGTRQTRHTHPSIRVGVVARGRGRCMTPECEYPLQAGLVFVIAPGSPHSFFTDAESLDVVVYHPDSDTGPTHEDHPMINRTVIDSS